MIEDAMEQSIEEQRADENIAENDLVTPSFMPRRNKRRFKDLTPKFLFRNDHEHVAMSGNWCKGCLQTDGVQNLVLEDNSYKRPIFSNGTKVPKVKTGCSVCGVNLCNTCFLEGWDHQNFCNKRQRVLVPTNSIGR